MLVPTTRASRTATLLAGLFLLLLVPVAAGWGPLESADREISRSLHRWAVAHDGWTEANRVLTDRVWDPMTMRALLAVAVCWLAWRREWRLAFWVVLTSALGTVLQWTVKATVRRERPRWPDPVDSGNYFAFPSGHAVTATVSCGLVLWLLARHGVRTRWLAPAAAVATVSVLGVGFTRVYLGVHWTSDVLGGWLLGAALVAAAVATYEPARTRGAGRDNDHVRDGRVPS
ncbi:phosphatase PAP2 family protein [Streptomyces sp. P1-3]|uniref:phosphatase PAP2 family protein n=1 Tax=Streptomyces sp. P1-3 TaxID=3421658 RepID=UPI003D35CC70